MAVLLLAGSAVCGAAEAGAVKPNFVNDIGESADVAAPHPDIVQQLESEAEKARADLGDAWTKRPGPGRREPGRVAEVKPASVQ